MKKNVIVTGGYGFIGSNFVNHHRKDFGRMLIIDSMTYAADMNNVFADQQPDHFQEDDIRELSKEGLDYDLEATGIDPKDPIVLINFAAESHVDNSISGSKIFIQSNVEGTHNLLEILMKRNTPGDKFIQVSTDEVYGSVEEHSADENFNLKPNNPYSATKASADMLVRAFHKTHGLDVNITRCCNNYGPNQACEKFIPVIINCMLEKKSIPLYGDGKNTREWIHVQDHCSAIMRVVESGKPGEIYNIGSDTEKQNKMMIYEIAKALSEITETSAKEYRELITHVSDRPGHDLRYSLNSNKIKKELRWVPSRKFSEGIAETVRYYTYIYNHQTEEQNAS